MPKEDLTKTKAQLVEELDELRRQLREQDLAQSTHPPLTHHASHSAAAAFSSSVLTVLVVDDSSIVRKSIKRDLSEAGYKVITAATGKDARALLDSDPAAVLLDLHLPGMSGLEVLKQIHQTRPGLPVIMLTAAGDLESRIEAFAAGADDYLLKPYHKLELLTRLDRLIRLNLDRFALLSEIDKREQAQRGLKESEEKLRLIVENAGALIAIIDRTGAFEYISPSHRRLGYEPDDLVGHSGFEKIHPDDRPRLAAELTDAQKRDTSGKTISYRAFARNGEVHYLKARFDAIRDAGGNLEKMITIAEDLTRQQWLEESLRQSEERWLFALEGSGDGVWDWDVTTNRVFYSRQWKLMLGYNESDIGDCLDEWEKRVHPDDLPGAMKEITRHLAGESAAYSTEHRLRCKDGSYKWVLDRGKVMSRTPSGQPLRVIGTHTDISERRRMEEEIRESRHTLAALIDNLPGFIYRCHNDRDWTMTYISGGCLDITGYASEDFIDNRTVSYNAIVRPDHQQSLWDDIQARLGKREVFQEEYPIITRSGDVRWVWEQGRGVFAPDGSLLYLEGFITDVTEKKRAQETIKVQRDLGIALSATVDLSEALEIYFQAAAMISGMECGGVYLKSVQTGSLDLHLHQGLSPAFVDQIKHIDGDGESARLVMRGRPIYANHRELGVPLDEARIKEGLRSIAIIPICNEGEVIGCLNIASHQYDAVPEFARGALEIIVSQIGSVIARIRSEEALRESEERFRIASACTNDLIYEWSMTTNRLQWFGDLDGLLGFAPGEVPRDLHGFRQLIHPDDQDRTFATLADHLRTGNPYRQEYRMRAANGEYLEFSSSGTLLRDQSGNPYKWIGAITNITKRKRAEEALRASEASHRALIENVKDVFSRYDLQFRYRFISPNVSDYLDLKPEDLIGKTHREAGFPEKTADLFDQALARVGATGKPVDIEFDLNGHQQYYFEACAYPEFDENGAVKSIVTVTRDVTGRKRTEEALRKSEERSRIITENISDMVWLMDMELKVIYVSPSVVRARGFTLAELQAMSLDQHFSPASMPTVAKILAEELTPERLAQKDLKIERTLELEFTRKDGSAVLSEITMTLIKDQEGKPVGFVGVGRDITKRKRAEEELKESERRLAEIINFLPVATFVIDREGKVTAWNRALEIMTGVKAETILGAGDHEYSMAFYGERRPIFIDLVHAAPEEIEGRYRDVVKFQGLAMGETFLPKLGEKGLDVIVYASELFDSQGRPAGGIESIMDITDLKRAEKSLLRLNRQLRSISNCNQTLLRAADEQSLLKEICRIICDEAGYRLAWVGYAEHDEAKTVHPVAWAGYDSGYIANSKLSWADDTERGRGPAGKVIRSGEIIYIQDFTTDPQMALWRESALQHGYRSGIALPLKDENAKVFGVLLIYASEINAITPDEILLLDELAGDLAFGITVLRTRVERKRAELALEESGAKLRSILDNIGIGVALISPQMEILELNRRMCEWFPAVDPGQHPICYRAYNDPPREAACDYCPTIKTLRDGVVHEATTQTPQAGVVHNYRVVSSPILSAAGEVTAAIEMVEDVTESKRAQEALRESEERYRIITENMSDTVWLMDMNFSSIYISPSVTRTRGFTLAEIQALPLEKNFSPATMRILAKIMSEELTPVRLAQKDLKIERTMELEFSSKDDSFRWNEVTITLVRNQEGKPSGFVGLGRDITKRKQAEEELKESQRRLAEIINFLPVATFVIDREGRVTAWNRALELMTGVRAETILGAGDHEYSFAFYGERRPIFIDLVNASPEELEGRYRDVVKHDGLAMGETFLPKLGKDGLDVMAYASELRDSQGRRAGGIESIMDITDRKRAEEALRESEKRFRELVDASPNSVLVTQDNKFVFANPACLRILGYEEHEFLGLDVMTIFSPDTHELIRRRLLNAEQGKPNKPLEYNVRRKDGGWVPVESISVPIQYNQRPAVMAIVSDTTERKQIEEERLKSGRLESIGVLAGGIAHDFNNILMGITGNIALVKMELNAGEDPRDSLRGAEQAADRARDLTRQLLTFSRGGKPIIGVESVRDIITEAVGFVRHGANVKCDLTLAADLLPARVDAGQISQVIHNLVINAIQAMPEGGNVLIAAENTRLDETNQLDLPAGLYVLISVADKGHGIAPEILPKIFDPYFTTKTTGSGLGLASSYSIVSRHQGKITVESEVGRGSAFRVYLPASEAKLHAGSRPKPQMRKGSGRILVMDDEVEVRKIVRRMLERLGYTVETAENGEGAIKKYQAAMAENKPYAAVIFDLTVPGGMGGREAVLAIKGLDPAAKAIVASGYSEDPVMSNFSDFGFAGMVAKPYKLEELDQIMQSVLAPE